MQSRQHLFQMQWRINVVEQQTQAQPREEPKRTITKTTMMKQVEVVNWALQARNIVGYQDPFFVSSECASVSALSDKPGLTYKLKNHVGLLPDCH